jgi:predicted GNAT family acetyltransferase
MWHVTNDVEVYAGHAWDLLAADPEASTVALTIIEALRSGFKYSDDFSPSFGWFERADGSADGAFSITPPWPLLLSLVPDESTDGLVEVLREHEVPVNEAHGSEAVAKRFSEAWTAGTPLRVEDVMRQRLYRLGELRTPVGTPGGARVATEEDLGLVAEWSAAFNAEAGGGGHHDDYEKVARATIDAGTMMLWEANRRVAYENPPVAMAGRREAAAGVARVGPVYTPPVERRRGYGAAVTAACTQAALDAGAESVVLFTDIANPVSNSIYQAIGYVPVSDRLMVRFVEGGA